MPSMLLLLAFTLLSTAPTRAAACDDQGKVYKVCGDQEATYAAKLGEAKKNGKLLVAVIGAEWCPWCQAMHKMLSNPSFGKEYAKSYVFADVGVYNGKQHVASGDAILDRIKKQAGYTKKIEGIPVLAVVNPANGKARIIDTEPLEHNTKTTKGHDPVKVLAALEKASAELR